MGSRIVPYLWNPLFWGIVILALVTNYFQPQHASFWSSYGMDILALPIYLYVAQVAMKVYYNRSRYEIPYRDRWIVWCLVCLIFEVILPQFSNKYTSDWLDCVAYLIGFVAVFPIVNTLPNFLVGSRVYSRKKL